MFGILLLAPIISPVGLGIALWAYPWRKARLQPYLWVALTLLAPLAVLVLLVEAFGLPAGSCVDRSLNYLPLVVAAGSVVLAVALSWKLKEQREFVVGASLAACPLVLFGSMLATMNLAGCWI
jgi:hypothetical protein